MSRPGQVALLVCGVLLVLAGGTGVVLLSADGPDQPARSGTEAASTPAPGAPVVPAEPTVVDWGGLEGRLAVVVRNDAEVAVRRSRVLITALDERRRPVLATTGRATSKCCTVVGLRPGDEAGLFVDAAVDLDLDRVDSVVVRYLDPEVGRVPGPVTTEGGRLERTGDDAVVTVQVTTSGGSPYVLAQASLVDEDGDLVAVASGRFWCFTPGTTRTVRVQLTRPVPPGTRLGAVHAQSVPAHVPVHVPHTCN